MTIIYVHTRGRSILKKFKKTTVGYTFTVIAIFLLTSCESIPPGIPPEGPIVSITPTNNCPLSSKDAINNMTTAIATCSQLYLNQDIPVVSLYPIEISDNEKEYGPQLSHLTARLYRNLIEMNIIKPPSIYSKNSINFLIASSYSRIFSDTFDEEENQPLVFNWKVKLLSPVNTSNFIWKQSIEIKLDKKPGTLL
jgi:hypothetical protein